MAQGSVSAAPKWGRKGPELGQRSTLGKIRMMLFSFFFLFEIGRFLSVCRGQQDRHVDSIYTLPCILSTFEITKRCPRNGNSWKAWVLCMSQYLLYIHYSFACIPRLAKRPRPRGDPGDSRLNCIHGTLRACSPPRRGWIGSGNSCWHLARYLCLAERLAGVPW